MNLILPGHFCQLTPMFSMGCMYVNPESQYNSKQIENSLRFIIVIDDF